MGGAKPRSSFGKIRPAPRGGWRIDLRPHGWVYGHAGIAFGSEDRERAELVLELIRFEVDQVGTARAARRWLPRDAAANRIQARYAAWLEVKKREVEIGRRSPTTVREYTRYAREGGELDWWGDRGLDAITEGSLEDWSLWLAADRDLAPKTCRHVLGAFRTFCGWLRRQDLLDQVPHFPSVDVPEHEPTILSPADQAAVLAEIPEPVRGAFLAAALMGLRPGEIRALEVSDYTPPRGRELGLLAITKAAQGRSVAKGRIGPTKTKRNRTLPVPALLAQWIARHVEKRGRLEQAPLFTNPNAKRKSNGRWSHDALAGTWARACTAAGIAHVSLYEGTKHSAATHMLAATHDLESVRDYLGHTDSRSTRKYARVQRPALVRIARRRS